MKTYEVSCVYGGFRIDSHTVKAGSEKSARNKVRKKYKSARDVRDVKARQVQP